MRKKIICCALSAMLILTFIPQITFAVEDAVEMAEGEEITTDAQADSAEEESLESESAEEEEILPTEAVQEEPAADDGAEQEEAAETAEDAVYAESGVITGFAPLETSEYWYEGNPDESDLTLNLPDSLSVYLDGSDQLSDIEVSWEAVEDFDDTDFYFYSMKPVWDEDIVLSDALSEAADVPWITVYKQEPSNYEVEPVQTEEEIEPIYTEEEGPVDPDPDITVDSAAGTLKALALDTAEDIVDSVTEDAYADTAKNTAAIYKYLTGTMGLNKAAACGVMININAESGMSPINLQNTYNSRFGLSDSAYTKAVDRGKGSYRTSGGRSQNFKTDSGGYGLCQWTSSGRKSNLLKRALSQGKSIGDINMQLGFLDTELQGYKSVYTTLKGVPNNAAGAYIAAAEFCLAFEIPANTVNTAASRARNCLSNYWKTYSGSSASATGTSFVSLCGYSYPLAIKKGKGIDITGYAVSNYRITSVTGKIINSSGKAVYSKTLKPGTTAYKLSHLDGAMKFGSLGTGTYTYKITAKDSHGKFVTASHKFKVSTSGSTSKTLGFMANSSVADPAQSSAAPSTQTAASSAPAKVKQAYPGPFPKIPKRGYFKKGDKGKQVKRLQKFLKWYGYKVKVTGTYKTKTYKAVKKFQKSMGIKATGRFGKKSLAKAKKVKK